MPPLLVYNATTFRGLLRVPMRSAPRVVSEACDTGGRITRVLPTPGMGRVQAGAWFTLALAAAGLPAWFGWQDAVSIGAVAAVMAMMLVTTEIQARRAARRGPLLVVHHDGERGGKIGAIAVPGCALEWNTHDDVALERLSGRVGGRAWNEIHLRITSHGRHYIAPIVTLENRRAAESICNRLTEEVGLPCLIFQGLHEPRRPTARRGEPVRYLAEACE